jgi:hypothetical protein
LELDVEEDRLNGFWSAPMMTFSGIDIQEDLEIMDFSVCPSFIEISVKHDS